MAEWVLACATTVVMAFVPGAILLGLFVPAVRHQRILWFAASPPVTVGWLFAVSQALDLVGLPTSQVTHGLAFGTAVAVHRLARRRDRPTRHGSDPDHASSVIMLVVSMAIGITVWFVALDGQPHNPPSRDGEYHGYFVKRIAETGSVSPAKVITTDPVTEEQAAAYYPLALHNAVALQHMTLGQDIGLLLRSWVVICSALALPAGLFVLVRRLVPGNQAAAGFTALVTPFVAMFPYGPAAWSGLSLIASMAFVPVTVVLVGQSGDAVPHRPGSIGAAGLAVFGVASTHTSQLGLLAIWLFILALRDVHRERNSPAIRRRATGLGAVIGLSMLLYLPALASLGGASAKRAAFAGQPYLSLGKAFGELVTMSHGLPAGQGGALGLLVIVGLCLAVRDRVLRGWTVCLACVVLLYLATAVVGGPIGRLRPLTQPWYYSSWRTSYNVGLSLTVLAGYALARSADLVSWASSRWTGNRETARLIGPAIVVVAFSGAGALTLLHRPIDIVRTAYATNSPASGDQLRAFQFLSAQVPKGQPVLNEERDGSTWMYAEHGLRPLMGVYAYEPTDLTDDRIYLATHIADYATDKRVRALLERWDIGYLLVNETGFVDEPPRVRPSDLAGRPEFTEVFTSGGSHVYRIQR